VTKSHHQSNNNQEEESPNKEKEESSGSKNGQLLAHPITLTNFYHYFSPSDMSFKFLFLVDFILKHKHQVSIKSHFIFLSIFY